RLQEWVAEEKGYFKDEGLEYEFRETVKSSDGKIHDKGDKQGAMQSFEAGRKANVSCACHWTVNVAAAKGHGRLYNELYSVTPACRSRSATSRAATTRPSRRSSPISSRKRSTSSTRTACCSRAWKSCSKE